MLVFELRNLGATHPACKCKLWETGLHAQASVKQRVDSAHKNTLANLLLYTVTTEDKVHTVHESVVALMRLQILSK